MTIDPPPLRAICGAAAWVVQNRPSTPTESMRRDRLFVDVRERHETRPDRIVDEHGDRRAEIALDAPNIRIARRRDRETSTA